MITQHSDALSGSHPNASTVEGLREVADWLEAHPELPKCYHASVCVVVRYMTRKPGEAREQLIALAHALGERATENQHMDGVAIAGQFGSVRVYGTAPVTELADPPAPVEYEPIIPVSHA